MAIWGEMGSSWGIPRTMAEVHALLYITNEAMCTDDLMQRLQISRGNASMSLRSLTDWGIVTRVHKRGDRKEYFRAEQDVWQMFRTILRERKRREIDPVLASLYECRDLTSGPSARSLHDAARQAKVDKEVASADRGQMPRPVDAAQDATLDGPEASREPECAGAEPERVLAGLELHNERLDAMLAFMELVDQLTDRFINRDGNGLRMAAGILGKVV